MAIITIGGKAGAGKTTLASKLAKLLGYEELSIGKLFRQLAGEGGVTIETFYAQLKHDPSLEKNVDDRQKKLMQKKDDLIVQGRVAWFFAKESPFTVFNILLEVDPLIGAERTGRREEHAKTPLAELARLNAEREHNELDRYRSLYGIENFLDYGHYDFVLDTSRLSEDEVVKTIATKIKDRIGEDV